MLCLAICYSQHSIAKMLPSANFSEKIPNEIPSIAWKPNKSFKKLRGKLIKFSCIRYWFWGIICCQQPSRPFTYPYNAGANHIYVEYWAIKKMKCDLNEHWKTCGEICMKNVLPQPVACNIEGCLERRDMRRGVHTCKLNDGKINCCGRWERWEGRKQSQNHTGI